MQRYGVFQGNKRVGTVLVEGENFTVETDDPVLETSIRILRERTLVYWAGRDARKVSNPEDEGHLDVVLTSGALVRYGFVGMRDR